MSEYKLTVGLEIHVELKTKTKMFCGCVNDPFNAKPNIHVCPVCYGMPGALPLLNKRAVEMTVELGQALQGKINSPTFWARKNYFYPDLPKGYQISQSTSPIVEEAKLAIEGQEHRIQRIHLEEDAGKLVHQAGSKKSLVNYNRAGVPLMEMVTYPDFNSAEAAKRFCQELQRVMRSLQISDADMEKGQMRCEANISVSKTDEFGTKVEVKNINSFRHVERAITYEYDRQIEALQAGQEIVQETRTWNDPEGKTVSMRTKETSADYRYFPEPDLPAVEIPVGKLKTHKLPDERRQDLEKMGAPADIARTLVDRGFDEAVLIIDGRDPTLSKDAVHLMLDSKDFAAMRPDDQVKLLTAKKQAGWTKDTLGKILEGISSGKSIEEAMSEFAGTGDLGPVISEVVAANPKPVADFNAGKENALHFLVGQVMAKTKGRANIGEVRKALEDSLKQP